MKRTKIICTMGPASSKKNTLRAMMRAGMDIARFNFSHGSHEEHRGRSRHGQKPTGRTEYSGCPAS